MCAHLLQWAPKLQLAVEQPLPGGCWNTPKKDTLHPKTKKKPHWDGLRGCSHDQIKPHTRWWVTHRLENSNTKEVLALLWRFWTPSQASQPGHPTKGLGFLRESGLQGQQDLIIGLPEDWGKQKHSSLREHKQNFACTKTHRRGAVTSQEPEPPLPASVGGPPVEHGLAGAHHRDGALEGPPWCKPSWSSPLTLP